jgi:Protein of unknown function (DUF2723)
MHLLITGTAHPPGYPLFTLLYHAAMMWPYGSSSNSSSSYSPAWRANVLSALLSAAAAGLLASSITLLRPATAARTCTSAAALIAACGVAAAYALSPLVWQYAVTSEVFALNNFFAALLLRQTLAFAHKPSWQRAAVGALTCGLALTNQHTVVLLAVPLAAWVLLQCIVLSCVCRETAAVIAQKVAGLAGCFFVGLLPYVYVPIAALLSPKVSTALYVQVCHGVPLLLVPFKL